MKGTLSKDVFDWGIRKEMEAGELFFAHFEGIIIPSSYVCTLIHNVCEKGKEGLISHGIVLCWVGGKILFYMDWFRPCNCSEVESRQGWIGFYGAERAFYLRTELSWLHFSAVIHHCLIQATLFGLLSNTVRYALITSFTYRRDIRKHKTNIILVP